MQAEESNAKERQERRQEQGATKLGKGRAQRDGVARVCRMIEYLRSGSRFGLGGTWKLSGRPQIRSRFDTCEARELVTLEA